MRLLRAWQTLVWLSARRMLFSSSTLVVLLPVAISLLFVLHRNYGAWDDSARAFDRFSRFLVAGYLLFVIPICTLAYGTSSLGGDREDRTLLFLLVRPIPRALVLLGKFSASVPLALGLLLACFGGYCLLAGEVGRLAWNAYLPAVVLSTIAYLAVFHLFAVVFRHATTVALIYALFMELVLGHMPGIIKRVAISYYGRALMYAGGEPWGVRAPPAQWFEPISATAATWALAGLTVASLAAALAVFQWREYRDLT